MPVSNVQGIQIQIQRVWRDASITFYNTTMRTLSKEEKNEIKIRKRKENMLTSLERVQTSLKGDRKNVHTTYWLEPIVARAETGS